MLVHATLVSILMCGLAATAALAQAAMPRSNAEPFAAPLSDQRPRLGDMTERAADGGPPEGGLRSRLAHAFARAALGERPLLSGQCTGADRASVSRTQLRFRERTARAADQAAVTAATMADMQSQAANASLSIAGLQQCAAGFELERAAAGLIAGDRLQLTGDFNVIEDKATLGLDGGARNHQAFGSFGADYALPSLALGPLAYDSSVGYDGSYSQQRIDGMAGSSRQNSLIAKHGLSWSYRGVSAKASGEANISLLSLGVSQTAMRSSSADGAPESSLAQSLRASWSRSSGATSRSLLSAALTETRTQSPGRAGDSSNRRINLLARHDRWLSAVSRLSLNANVLESERRARSLLDESLLEAFGASPLQSTAVSLRSAGANYQRSTFVGGARLDLSLGISALRNELRIDSFGLIKSRLGSMQRMLDAGLDYSAGQQGLRLTTRARLADSGAFSVVFQIAKDL